MRTLHFSTLALCGLLLLSSCGEDKKKEEQIKLKAQEEAEMAQAQKDQELKDAQMKEEQLKQEARANSISSKAMNTRELDTLVIALKAAGLDSMLMEKGTYTVFAPTDYAFSKLKKGTLDDLTKAENKEKLTGVLQYHVLPEIMNSEDLSKAIEAGNGKAKLTTVKGNELTFMRDGDQIVIRDEKGQKAQIVLGNIDASNGIIHQVDKVLMAKN